MSGIAYYPPTTYFQNINFNNDFYAIPNNNQGISLAYADTHFLFSTGVATSMAITTYFSGSVGIGTIASTAGTLNALTINAINAIELNGINISTLYQPIINTYTVSGGTGGSMAFSSGTLTLILPTSYSSMTINSLTTATSFIYKGTELSTTLNNYLLLSGGTLTGTLTGTTINATTLQQGGTALNTIITNNLSSYSTTTQKNSAIAAAVASHLPLTGGSITNNLTVNNNLAVLNNVGIGTNASPTNALVVVGNIIVNGIGALVNTYNVIINNTLNVSGLSSFNNNVGIGTTSSSTNTLFVNGTSYMSSNVGIGTTPSSTNALTVKGTSYMSTVVMLVLELLLLQQML